MRRRQSGKLTGVNHELDPKGVQIPHYSAVPVPLAPIRFCCSEHENEPRSIIRQNKLGGGSFWAMPLRTLRTA
jgi:hypothetical protein